MIEADIAAPVLLAVAAVAGRLEFHTVRAGSPMTGRTVRAELLLVGVGRMTGVASEPGVHADQCKFRFRQVVIFHRLPDLVTVATVALQAEAPGVRIIRLVAAVAILGNLVFEFAAAMTPQAINLGVAAQQREVGFLFVVEFRGLPFRRRVALAAIITTLVIMCVVGSVAAYTALGRFFVMATQMAGSAAHGPMRARQVEFGLAVIEVRAGPAIEVVTIGAGGAQLSFMKVVRLVAADAGGRGLAERLASLVAAGAGQRAMRASEGKISAFMIEGGRIQAHDIGFAAQMFGVTARTFADAGIGHAAVEALVIVHVAGDFLMAIEAQRALPGAISTIMAAAAGVFDLDVRLGHFPGHEQALDRSAMSERCADE